MTIFPMKILATFPPNYEDYSSEYFLELLLKFSPKDIV